MQGYARLDELAPPLLAVLALHPLLIELDDARVRLLEELREVRLQVLEDLVVESARGPS